MIVMIHGNPTWSFYYRHLIKQFSRSHRVIAPDHMGCGLSDKPQDYPYCLEQHINNVKKLLQNLEIDKFSLIVHDWGGAIGFGLTDEYLDGLEKIVVLNTAAFRSTRIPLRINICRIPIVGEVLVRFFNGFAWPALTMAVEKKMDSNVKKAYIAPYDSWNNRIAVYKFIKDIPLHAKHVSYEELHNIENRLVKVRDAGIPMKIIWGGKDFCFNDEFFSEWKMRFPEAEDHYFADAGHYILEDKKEEIAVLLADFFSK